MLRHIECAIFLESASCLDAKTPLIFSSFRARTVKSAANVPIVFGIRIILGGGAALAAHQCHRVRAAASSACAATAVLV
jgi:hypothetical protein